MSTGKDKKPPCNCRNSCQTKDGPKRKGCPCRNVSVYCTADCRCGTDKYPCKNIETSCKCQNSCQTKNGPRRAGRPCRDEGLPCTERCNCGTKKYPCENIEKPDTQKLPDSHRSKSADNPRLKITVTPSGPPKKEATVEDNSDTIDDSTNVPSGERGQQELGSAGLSGARPGRELEATYGSDDVKYLIRNGFALMIHNRDFPNNPEEPYRLGSEEDARRIREFCVEAGLFLNETSYKTTNCEASEMEELCRNLGKRDFTLYDAFVCFILSHGTEGGIQGVDGNVVPLENIVNKFRDNATLVGKPKLFFVQACRGPETDGGLVPDSYPVNRPRPSVRLPTHADILVANATVKDHRAFRMPEHGSLFIISLMKQLKSHASHMHILEILTLVNQELACLQTTEGKKQVSCQMSTLTNFVFFNMPPPPK